jgi:hypothetical protein
MLTGHLIYRLVETTARSKDFVNLLIINAEISRLQKNENPVVQEI